MKTGIELITEERQRQIGEEGWSEEHDDQHTAGELAIVAACYAAADDKDVFVLRGGVNIEESHLPAIVDAWPETWAPEWDKRKTHSRIRQLQIAGALIAAELDRLGRIDKAKALVVHFLPFQRRMR